MNDFSLRIIVAAKSALTTFAARARSAQEGATAAEYALLVALIAVAIIFGATTLGSKIGAAFTQTGNHIGTKVTAGINAAP